MLLPICLLLPGEDPGHSYAVASQSQAPSRQTFRVLRIEETHNAGRGWADVEALHFPKTLSTKTVLLVWKL